MAKVVRHLREGQTEFQKVMANLCNSKSSWQVWSDFIEMAAISIANSCEIRETVRKDREEKYRYIMEQYTKAEQAIFPELLGILIASLERNPEQDFLGEMFMALELGSHWKGQFFTPYSLCNAMAKINVASAKERLAEKEWIGINDPACGAGATLIAARNEIQAQGIGSTQAFFVGQDIDRTTAMMCYIQLSLLGCAGYVVVADTLCHPVTGPMLWPNLTEHQEAWFTPITFLDPVWAFRLSQTWRGKDTDAISCHEKETVEEEAPTTEPQECEEKPAEAPAEIKQEAEMIFQDSEGGQLILF